MDHNEKLYLADPIIDRARLPGEPFSFRLYPETFAHQDGDPLDISIAMADGSEIPTWLTFDGAMFRGTAPAGFDGALDIRVTASDGTAAVNDVFQLIIGPDAPVLKFDAGKGVNLGNALDAPNEGDWGYVLIEEYVQEIVDQGFDTVRLPVRWSNHTDENNVIDEAFFQRVEEVMDWLLARDLQVIVNQHHFDRPIDGTHEEVLKTIWSQVATRFADMPDNVYFELYNEPHNKFQGPEAFDTLAEVLKVVRETNPTRAVVIGGDDWSSVRNLNGLELPNDDYVVPTVHYYVPFDFTHQGIPWKKDPPPIGYDWGSEVDLQRLEDDFALIAAWREETGDMPFYMGEFGVYFTAEESERAQWAEAVREAADEAGISWTWWSFHTIYDVFGTGNGGWTEGVLDVLKVTPTMVDPDNIAPILDEASLSGPEDSAITGQVTATDENDDPLTFSKVANPENGSVVVAPDGSFIYTPDPDFHGTDAFKVRVEDGRGGRDEIYTVVTVTPENDAPVAGDASESLVQNTGLSGQLPATDADGDQLTFALIDAPELGQVIVDADGSWRYTPNADVTGSDTFTFSVTDTANETDTGAVSLTITDTPPPYTERAGTDGVDRLEGTDGRDLLLPGLGDDRVFAKGGDDRVAFSGGSDRVAGGAGADVFALTDAFLTNGRADKVKVVDFEIGADSVDLGVAMVTRVVEQNNRVILTLDTGDTLELIGVNDVDAIDFVAPETNDDPNANPLIVPDAPIGDEDTDITGQVSATDDDGDPLRFVKTTDPDNGTVTVAADGSYTYQPNANFNGSDSFEVEAQDGRGGTDRATVSVTVNPVNDAPEATAELATGNVNGVVTGNVLATDPDGDGVTFTKVADPANGTAEIAPDGSYTYTPALDFAGDDSFDVVASDGNGGEDRVTVNVRVAAPNDPPVAFANAASGNEDTDITGFVTANDPNGDLVTFSKASDATHGSVTVNADGTYTYTPDADFFGPDTFEVLADDGKGGTDQVLVDVDVLPINDAPIATDAGAMVKQNGQTSGQLIARDVDGDILEFSLDEVTTKGDVSVNADGTWEYTPNPDAAGPDSFVFEVSDGMGGLATGTVDIDIINPSQSNYTTLTGSAGRDLLDGAEDRDDALFGGAGNDRLDGRSGNDLLSGGSGNDKLFGGADDDLLLFEGEGIDRATGGSGADTFVLTAGLSGNGAADKVKIVDYETGIDIVDLGGAAITGVTALNKRLRVEIGTEGDTLEFLNLTEIDMITFAADSPIT